MSKPNMPGELRNVDVKCVSLVDKGANRRTFKIFKSADWPEDDTANLSLEQQEKNEVRGFFRVLKEFFAGNQKAEGSPQEAPSFHSYMRARETDDAMWEAFSALRDVCMDILRSELDNKPAHLTTAIEDFKHYILGTLAQVGATKVLEQLEQVEKAGRKISAARLKTLKDAYSLLAQIIEEVEGEDGEEGVEMTKEELAKMVAETVNEATKSISERLEQLEKQAAVQDVQDDGKVDNKEELVEMIKGAVAEAIKPLEQRLETVEKARGISNRLPEEKEPIEKNSFWSGAFLG